MTDLVQKVRFFSPIIELSWNKFGTKKNLIELLGQLFEPTTDEKKFPSTYLSIKKI